MKSSDFMTLREVCEYWRMSPSAARARIKELQIAKYSIGGSSQAIRYNRKDIENVIQVQSR